MENFTVRDISDDVLLALRREAEEQGKSVHAVVGAALAEHVARRRQVHHWRERVREMDALRLRVAHRLGIPMEDVAS